MKPSRIHTAGPPPEAEPPAGLLEAAEHLEHPLVRQAGITTTATGEWALYVSVPRDTDVPLPAVEAAAKGYPVVYEAEPPAPPRAGPARPGPRLR